MKNILFNKFYRRIVTLILFILAIFPLFVQESREGAMSFFELLLAPLGIWGWTDYGITIFHILALGMVLLSIIYRKELELRAIDKLLNTIIIIISGALVCYLAFVMIVVSIVF